MKKLEHNYSLVPDASVHVQDRIELVVLAARQARMLSKEEMSKEPKWKKRSTVALERIGSGKLTKTEMFAELAESLRQVKPKSVDE